MLAVISFRHRGEEGVGAMQGVLVNERKYLNEEDAQVTVSFQLTAHDWCLLQKMPEWIQVEKQILEIQKGYSQKRHQGSGV